MKLDVLLACAALSAPLVAAHGREPNLVYKYDALEYQACASYIGKTATFFARKDKKKYCNLKNQQALGSMAHCLIMGYGENSKSVDYFLNDICHGKISHEKFMASYENATDYLIDPTKTDGFNKTAISYSPVKLKPKKLHDYWMSIYTRFINYNWTTWFSVALYSYWFLVFIVAGICNLCSYMFPNFVNSFNGAFSRGFRKYITLAPTGRRVHVERKSIYKVIELCVPTRLETIIVFGWFILALAFNISHIDHYSPNTVWKIKNAEMGRKISDRSGIMATFLMPIQILFAGRNNFLQWVSGWSYSRMIVFHKWVSRIVFALVFVHTVSMSVSGVAIGKFASRNARAYVQWGYVATVCGLIILIQALSQFRRTNYELFLLIHIVMAVFWVAGGWLHVADMGYQAFYYCATAVWVFDRAVRLGRLAFFGIQKATVELRANEILKVTVPRPKLWKPFPGCHAFIHFIRPTMFWQSHPFTIVDSVTQENTIVFYIKLKGGVTHGLYQYLSQQPGHRAQIRCCVEGPYGNPIPLSKYKTSVLVAGGNGIPGLYSEAADLARKNHTDNKVKLYWIVRHYHSIQWFYEELKKLQGTNVETIVYVTKPTEGLALPFESSAEPSDEDEKASENKEPVSDSLEEFITSIKVNLPHVQFYDGRPNIQQVIKQEVEESAGSIAFVACAHASMVDDMRLTVMDNLSAEKRVDYYESIQQW